MRKPVGAPTPPYLFIAIFVVLAGIIVTTASVLYARQQRQMKELRYKDLQSIAELLTSRIAQWRGAQTTAAQSAALACAEVYAAVPSSASRTDGLLRTVLRAYVGPQEHAAVHFLDRRAASVVHADSGPCPVESVRGDSPRLQEWARALALSAMQQRSAAWSGLRANRPGGYCLDIAVPVAGPTGETLGAVILSVEVSQGLFRLADGWQAPTNSMQALLIMPADGAMVRLRSGAVPRHTGRRSPEPLDERDVMVVQAVNGRTGHLRGPVPQSAEAYGHIAPVPGSDWLVLVREDANESNEPARAFGGLWITIVLSCVAAAFAALVAIWRNQRAREYRRLYESEVEQLRAEREAFESRSRLELIMNTIPQRVFWKDRESRYLGCNRPFAMDAGYQNPDDLIGRDDYAMSWKENADAYRRDDQTVMQSGEPKVGYVEPQIRTDGTFSWLRTSKVPLRDPDGKVTGVLGTYEDITAMVQAEEALEEKNRELTGVLSAVSHDLRTPLVSLTGYTGEVRTGLEELRSALTGVTLPPDVADRVREILDRTMPSDLAIIAANAERMNKLLSGVLAISRIGRMELTIETLRMNDLVGEVAASHLRRAQELGASIEVGNLPNCRGDAVQITRVFDNLLSNALKYLDPSRPGRIRITGQVQQGNAVYCVEDNGIGIRPEDQERIFELFQRAGQPSAEGEGLGLTTVRTIVTRHGGRVWVESSPGEGSRFYVRLPRRADDARGENRSKTGNSGPGSDPRTDR